MTNEWLTGASQWGLRTWVALAFLSLLPIGLATVLFQPASRGEGYSTPVVSLVESLEQAAE